MYFCLPNIINPMYIQQPINMVPPPSQNTVAVCNQITLLILYYISSRLLSLLNITDVPIQVSDIFYLTVSFKFINFSFFFVPEMSTRFHSTLFRLSTLLWFGSFNHCTLACFLRYKNCEHSSSNHGLCCFNSYRP